MWRRSFLRGSVAAVATLMAGCTTDGGERDRVAVELLNRRAEPVTATVVIERLGGEDQSCREGVVSSTEPVTVTADPGERVEMTPVSRRGTYGSVFTVDTREIDSCFSYTGRESELVWVVSPDTVNFVSASP